MQGAPLNRGSILSTSLNHNLMTCICCLLCLVKNVTGTLLGAEAVSDGSDVGILNMGEQMLTEIL